MDKAVSVKKKTYVVPEIQKEEPVENSTKLSVANKDKKVEAFYYNTINYSESKATFEVYVTYESGKKVCIDKNLHIEDAIGLVWNTNQKLGLKRARRLYSL